MIFFRWLTLAWIIVTLVILGIPPSNFPSTRFPHADKVVHCLIFTVGSFITLRGWPDRKVWVILFLLAFAPLAEVWQHILPTRRKADPMDALANVTGVILGLTIAMISLRMTRAKD